MRLSWPVLSAAHGPGCAAGRAACLSVCGLITTRGYFNNPKRTTTLIGADGWLLSSDLSPGARQLP
jgi:hypothetical protein